MSKRSREREMVRRMIAGDEASFEEFTDDYVPQIYRFAARRLSGDRELVKDIVQTTVCKAIEKLATFRGEAALMTWLCACCNNEIAGHFRKLGRRGDDVPIEDVERFDAAELAPRATESPEASAARREAAERVHDALDTLPPHYGRALEWKYLEGLSVREIAARLELSPKATESVLTRARLAFRDRFQAVESAGGNAVVEFGGRRLEFGT
jgi:RNA polymerase sigma-70 factor (ECF subfamily)